MMETEHENMRNWEKGKEEQKRVEENGEERREEREVKDAEKENHYVNNSVKTKIHGILTLYLLFSFINQPQFIKV